MSDFGDAMRDLRMQSGPTGFSVLKIARAFDVPRDVKYLADTIRRISIENPDLDDWLIAVLVLDEIGPSLGEKLLLWGIKRLRM
jgi:hypothetical protein